MKVLLIIEKDSTRETIIEHLSPRGFDFIHYINPVKAIDNILEISPDMVIFSALDYPRHWKPFLKVLRLFRNREEAIFILLKGENFPVEESTKATILEVNGLIPDNVEDPLVMQQLEDIFSRYNVLDDNRLDRRYIAHASEDIEFVFSHPVTFNIISGSITDISLNGLCFKPEMPRFTQDIMEGIVLENCTLRVKDSYYTITSRVVRNNVQLSFKFIEPSEGMTYNLLEYFNSIPKLELDKILHQS